MTTKTILSSFLALTTLASFNLFCKPVQALTWNVHYIVVPDGVPVTGNFVIDDENPPNDEFPGDPNYPLVSANITVGGVTYTDVNNVLGSSVGIDASGNIIAINIVQNIGTDGCSIGFCQLTLNFNNPLLASSGGGNPGTIAPSSVVNQQGLNFAQVDDKPARVVPFNFSTTPGLVALGLITGVAKGRKHLPKIKEKFSQIFNKK